MILQITAIREVLVKKLPPDAAMQVVHGKEEHVGPQHLNSQTDFHLAIGDMCLSDQALAIPMI